MFSPPAPSKLSPSLDGEVEARRQVGERTGKGDHAAVRIEGETARDLVDRQRTAEADEVGDGAPVFPGGWPLRTPWLPCGVNGVQSKARHFPERSSSEVTDADHRAGHLPPVDREWLTCSDMSQGRAAVADQVVGKVAQREPAQLTALVWLAILRHTAPLVDGEEEGGTAAAR